MAASLQRLEPAITGFAGVTFVGLPGVSGQPDRATESATEGSVAELIAKWGCLTASLVADVAVDKLDRWRMVMRISRLSPWLLAILASVACHDATGPSERVVGIIGYEEFFPDDFPTPDPVEAPDTVRVGVPFDIVVTTLDFGMWLEEAGAEVQVSQLLAGIVPYDWEPSARLDGGRVRWLPRVVTVQFDRPGTALVVVQGQATSFWTVVEPWTVVERRITVLAD